MSGPSTRMMSGRSSSIVRSTWYDRPSAVMSTAEAVSVYYQAMITGYYYGDDDVRPQLLDCPVHMVRAGGTVMADRKQDYLSHFLAS